MTFINGNDRKVRVTVALYPEQVAELKAQTLDSSGERAFSLSRVMRAVIDFGLRDIRHREHRLQMDAESKETGKPHRQGQYDASLVAPVTKQVHDAVFKEAERRGEDRDTFLRKLIDDALVTIQQKQGQGPTISDGTMDWDLYGYYYIRIEQERGGYTLILRKTDGGPAARIGPLPSPVEIVALANLISSGYLRVDHREIRDVGRHYSLLFHDDDV